jgi:hypothetical protein
MAITFTNLGTFTNFASGIVVHSQPFLINAKAQLKCAGSYYVDILIRKRLLVAISLLPKVVPG